MKALRALAARAAGIFAGQRREDELAEEFASHLQLEIDERVRAGMSPESARRAALVHAGGIESAKDTYRDRRMFLIGDACHAIYPFYAQGVNAGFEDCRVLSECIERRRGEWSAIFHDYQTERKPNTDAIADMAVHHFSVLSKLVGEPEFQRREKIEKSIERLFPERASLYHNISFTNLPYVEAQRHEQQHQQLIWRE